jgi:hypothetical protein
MSVKFCVKTHKIDVKTLDAQLETQLAQVASALEL